MSFCRERSMLPELPTDNQADTRRVRHAPVIAMRSTRVTLRRPESSDVVVERSAGVRLGGGGRRRRGSQFPRATRELVSGVVGDPQSLGPRPDVRRLVEPVALGDEQNPLSFYQHLDREHLPLVIGRARDALEQLRAPGCQNSQRECSSTLLPGCIGRADFGDVPRSCAVLREGASMPPNL